MNFLLQTLALSLEVFYRLLKSFPFAYCWYKHAIDCRTVYGFRFNLEEVFQNTIHRKATTVPEYNSLKHLHLFLGSCNCKECLPAAAASFCQEKTHRDFKEQSRMWLFLCNIFWSTSSTGNPKHCRTGVSSVVSASIFFFFYYITFCNCFFLLFLIFLWFYFTLFGFVLLATLNGI